MWGSTISHAVYPRSTHLLFEKFYLFILDIFKQQVLSVRALRYFPLIFSLFMFIFFLNFTSLLSYNISLTGHILITAVLSFSIFFSLVIIGFLNFGSNFFNFFIPKNVPKRLLVFLVVIEVMSFAIRPFSLAIRLFANMLAGHTLMGIFAQFFVFISNNFALIWVLPTIIVLLVIGLEIAVALIQTYIFVSLVCIYVNDVYTLH